ncbi:unnamed protein product [Amoebophrya sp. A25]|nr:unnamed protein product [Amoebophrya sp. A25]|eukprot:GSA25T00026267001.1
MSGLPFPTSSATPATSSGSKKKKKIWPPDLAERMLGAPRGTSSNSPFTEEQRSPGNASAMGNMASRHDIASRHKSAPHAQEGDASAFSMRTPDEVQRKLIHMERRAIRHAYKTIFAEDLLYFVEEQGRTQAQYWATQCDKRDASIEFLMLKLKEKDASCRIIRRKAVKDGLPLVANAPQPALLPMQQFLKGLDPSSAPAAPDTSYFAQRHPNDSGGGSSSSTSAAPAPVVASQLSPSASGSEGKAPSMKSPAASLYADDGSKSTRVAPVPRRLRMESTPAAQAKFAENTAAPGALESSSSASSAASDASLSTGDEKEDHQSGDLNVDEDVEVEGRRQEFQEKPDVSDVTTSTTADTGDPDRAKSAAEDPPKPSESSYAWWPTEIGTLVSETASELTSMVQEAVGGLSDSSVVNIVPATASGTETTSAGVGGDGSGTGTVCVARDRDHDEVLNLELDRRVDEGLLSQLGDYEVVNMNEHRCLLSRYDALSRNYRALEKESRLQKATITDQRSKIGGLDASLQAQDRIIEKLRADFREAMASASSRTRSSSPEKQPITAKALEQIAASPGTTSTSMTTTSAPAGTEHQRGFASSSPGTTNASSSATPGSSFFQPGEFRVGKTKVDDYLYIEELEREITKLRAELTERMRAAKEEAEADDVEDDLVRLSSGSVVEAPSGSKGSSSARLSGGRGVRGNKKGFHAPCIWREELDVRTTQLERLSRQLDATHNAFLSQLEENKLLVKEKHELLRKIKTGSGAVGSASMSGGGSESTSNVNNSMSVGSDAAPPAGNSYKSTSQADNMNSTTPNASTRAMAQNFLQEGGVRFTGGYNSHQR